MMKILFFRSSKLCCFFFFFVVAAEGFLLATPPLPPAPSKKLGAGANDDDAAALLAEAERLRREAAVAEEALAEEMGPPQALPLPERKFRLRLPMSKPDWSVVEEEVEFSPKLESSSELVRVDVPVPCGMLLEECDDSVVVAEVAAESNAAIAGVRVGDVLRATSAVRAQMEMPTWQLLGGGIGRPRFFRFIYGADLAGPPRRSFDDVLSAVASNRDDPDNRPALLVLERRAEEEEEEVTK